MSTPAKKQDATASPAPKEEKVKLTARHTHAGTKYQAGAEIYVNTLDKAFRYSTRRSRSKPRTRPPPPRSKSCRCFPSRAGSGLASAWPPAN
ncbi:DUF7210 family protein [Pseudomonas aeruginosa]